MFKYLKATCLQQLQQPTSPQTLRTDKLVPLTALFYK